MQGAGRRVQGAGCRAQGAGCRVQGAGYNMQGVGSRLRGDSPARFGLTSRAPFSTLTFGVPAAGVPEGASDVPILELRFLPDESARHCQDAAERERERER